MTKETVIIGGGLIGVATLYELVARGEPAVLLEADGALAHGASFANGGMITASMSDPWNNPGVGRDLAASLFDPRAAMKLRLRALPGLSLWGLSFLRNSTPARHQRATRNAYALASRSARLLHGRIDELGLNLEPSGNGTMKVFESDASMKASLDLVDLLAPHGLRGEVLDRDGLLQKEPELRESAHRFVGGIYYPDDGTGDAKMFVEQLADAAKAKGARIKLGAVAKRIIAANGKVTGVETEEGVIPAAQVVIAAGYNAPALARPLGVRLPIKPAKGYSVTVDTAGWNARPRTTVVDEAMHAAVSVIGTRLRFVGTAEFAGDDKTIQPERINNLISLFHRLYPHLSRSLEATEAAPWTGLRPMSADGLPFIGQAGPGGLWINGGHGHLGWTMAAGSAEMLVDLMQGETPAIDPAPYDPARRNATGRKG